MKYHMPQKICLYALFVVLLLCAGCAGAKENETLWSRHAFLLDDDLVFIADVPEDWRYSIYPVNDYAYYYDKMNDRPVGRRHVEFVGMGERDGEDNFFSILVSTGSTGLGSPYDGEPSEYVQEPFVFQDGMQGIRKYHVWETHFVYSGYKQIEEAYSEVVYDTEEKYVIRLSMLRKEYNANETEIKRFLESACFRTSDLGESEEDSVYKKDLVTLHLWDEYLCMLLQVPEGSLIKKSYYNNDMGYASCAYTICFDESKSNYIVIRADSGDVFDSCGDTRYYLNVDDFDDIVYELTGFGGGYYFVNQHVQVQVEIDENDTELSEYVKKIVQSIEFE